MLFGGSMAHARLAVASRLAGEDEIYHWRSGVLQPPVRRVQSGYGGRQEALAKADVSSLNSASGVTRRSLSGGGPARLTLICIGFALSLGLSAVPRFDRASARPPQAGQQSASVRPLRLSLSRFQTVATPAGRSSVRSGISSNSARTQRLGRLVDVHLRTHCRASVRRFWNRAGTAGDPPVRRAAARAVATCRCVKSGARRVRTKEPRLTERRWGCVRLGLGRTVMRLLARICAAFFFGSAPTRPRKRR